MDMTERSVKMYSVLDHFFHTYLTERDVEGTLALAADDIYSLGTGAEEVAVNKTEFEQLLRQEVSLLPSPIEYKIRDYREKQVHEGCWQCCCSMETAIDQGKAQKIYYQTRLTADFREENGRYLATSLHMSEASRSQEDEEFFPLRFISEQARQVGGIAQRELLNILCQMMPCGIIGGYIEEKFPLYVINDTMLEMMGYTYDEFVEATGGMVANSFCEEDAERVCSQVFRELEQGTQYAIEYRVKKKDGGYLWVHDVGRKVTADDGREVIISVLIDISSDVQNRMKLLEETSRDYLTGVYNRKGGAELINTRMKEGMPYAFLMMDLDNFKRVNDHYGHDEGDKMLRYAGDVLRNTFRQTDVVMRLGGDEFAVLAYPCSDVSAIREKIESVIREYTKEAAEKYPLSRTSISAGGVYGSAPRTFLELYRLADDVLYEVKQTEKGTCRISDIDPDADQSGSVG